MQQRKKKKPLKSLLVADSCPRCSSPHGDEATLARTVLIYFFQLLAFYF